MANGQQQQPQTKDIEIADVGVFQVPADYSDEQVRSHINDLRATKPHLFDPNIPDPVAQARKQMPVPAPMFSGKNVQYDASGQQIWTGGVGSHLSSERVLAEGSLPAAKFMAMIGAGGELGALTKAAKLPKIVSALAMAEGTGAM